MAIYKNADNSGIATVNMNPAGSPDKWIDCTFHGGRTYRYEAGKNVTLGQLIDMKELALINGEGLCRYISRNRLR